MVITKLIARRMHRIYANDNLSIEAHYTLWEDYHGDNIDVLLKEKLDDSDTLILVPIADDISVWTLGLWSILFYRCFI